MGFSSFRNQQSWSDLIVYSIKKKSFGETSAWKSVCLCVFMYVCPHDWCCAWLWVNRSVYRKETLHLQGVIPFQWGLCLSTMSLSLLILQTCTHHLAVSRSLSFLLSPSSHCLSPSLSLSLCLCLTCPHTPHMQDAFIHSDKIGGWKDRATSCVSVGGHSEEKGGFTVRLV